MRTMTKQRPSPAQSRSFRRGPAPKTHARTSGGGAKKGLLMAAVPLVGGLVARKMRGRNRTAV